MKIEEGSIMTILEIQDYTHQIQFVKSIKNDSETYLSWIYNGSLLLSDSIEEISKEVFENIKYFFARCSPTKQDTDKDGTLISYTIKTRF